MFTRAKKTNTRGRNRHCKEYTPEWTGNITADYVMPLGQALELRTVLDLVYSDSYTFNPTLDPRSEQDSYTKVNLRVSLGHQYGTWELASIGRKLNDEDVVTYGGVARAGLPRALPYFRMRPCRLQNCRQPVLSGECGAQRPLG